MKRIVGSIIFLMSILLTGCEQGVVPETSEADAIARNFIKAIESKDYESMMAMVDDEFFGARSKQEWIAYLTEKDKIMGKMISYRLKTSTNDTRFSGTFYLYEYITKYENGLGKEIITMIHKINTNEPLKIFAYKIDSSKLQKLNQN